jgi:hypothetical protein
MSIIITTGSDKCKVLNLMECVICGDAFDVATGDYVRSETLGERVLVCDGCKIKPIGVKEELAIQDSLKRTLESGRGSIIGNKKFLKKSDIMKTFSPSKVASLWR